MLIFESSHWGRLIVRGADRLRFLHNQTTNTFQRRQPGEGCETLFVTATARTLDLATAYIETDRVCLLLSPQRYQFLLTWLDRYIFPADQVILEDITASTCCFRLLGTDAASHLNQLGVTEFPTVPHHHHSATIAGVPVQIALGSGLTQPGFTLIVAQSDGEVLKAALFNTTLKDGTSPQSLSPAEWETQRILDGRPAADAELTEEYNPLEAGLWKTLSFDKGCYIGQETIARLNTYQGVKQRLWGVELSAVVDPAPLFNTAGEKVGQLTSITPTGTAAFGLGYVRTKAGGEGLKVQVGNAEGAVKGTIVSVPFVEHPLYNPA